MLDVLYLAPGQIRFDLRRGLARAAFPSASLLRPVPPARPHTHPYIQRQRQTPLALPTLPLRMLFDHRIPTLPSYSLLGRRRVKVREQTERREQCRKDEKGAACGQAAADVCPAARRLWLGPIRPIACHVGRGDHWRLHVAYSIDGAAVVDERTRSELQVLTGALRKECAADLTCTNLTRAEFRDPTA